MSRTYEGKGKARASAGKMLTGGGKPKMTPAEIREAQKRIADREALRNQRDVAGQFLREAVTDRFGTPESSPVNWAEELKKAPLQALKNEIARREEVAEAAKKAANA